MSKGRSHDPSRFQPHTEQRDTYDGWKQVLEANPEDRVELDIDDWLFFFGRDVSRDQ